MVSPLGPEPSASANSATSAHAAVTRRWRCHLRVCGAAVAHRALAPHYTESRSTRLCASTDFRQATKFGGVALDPGHSPLHVGRSLLLQCHTSTSRPGGRKMTSREVDRDRLFEYDRPKRDESCRTTA